MPHQFMQYAPHNPNIHNVPSGMQYATELPLDSMLHNPTRMNTQAWMRDNRLYNFTHDYSRTGSGPSSIASHLTHITGTTDDMSMLSINTHSNAELQRIIDPRKTIHSSAPSSSSSCIENVNPERKKSQNPLNLEEYMDRIIFNLTTHDKKIERDLMRAIFTLTFNGSIQAVSSQKVETLLHSLMQNWLRNPEADPDIVEIILRAMLKLSVDGKSKQIMSRWMHGYPDELLEVYIRLIDPKRKFCKYALNTVHSLIEMVDKSKYKRETKEKILSSVIDVMKEMQTVGEDYFIKTSKSKQYVYDLVRRIYNGNDALRKYFDSKNGIYLLLELLKSEMNEMVVYRIVRALYAIVCSHDRVYGLRFVTLGGIQTISCLLANPYCSERITVDSLLILRAVSDLSDVRTVDNKEAISKIIQTMRSYRMNASVLTVAVDFLGNVSASIDDTINVNKEFILENMIVKGLVELLILFNQRRDEPNVKALISSIIWALHILTARSSSSEKVSAVRKQMVINENAVWILLFELANSIDASCRLYLLNLFIRIVEADQLNHPPLLFNLTINNNSITDILFEIISTTANTMDSNTRIMQSRAIIQRAYALLTSLANCNVNFSASIFYSCASYQIWDLLLSCQDNEVVKCTIDFITYVIKDERLREHLSKDCSLIETIRNLTTQMNDNSAPAQFLLYRLIADSEPIFAPIL